MNPKQNKFLIMARNGNWGDRLGLSKHSAATSPVSPPRPDACLSSETHLSGNGLRLTQYDTNERAPRSRREPGGVRASGGVLHLVIIGLRYVMARDEPSG